MVSQQERTLIHLCSSFVLASIIEDDDEEEDEKELLLITSEPKKLILETASLISKADRYFASDGLFED